MHIKIPEELVRAAQLGKNRVAIFYQLCRQKTYGGKIIFQPAALADELNLSKFSCVEDIIKVTSWMAKNGYIEKIAEPKLKTYCETEFHEEKFNPGHYALIGDLELELYEGKNLAEAMLVLACVRMIPGNYKANTTSFSKLIDMEVNALRKRIDELAKVHIISKYRGYGCIYLDGGIKHA